MAEETHFFEDPFATRRTIGGPTERLTHERFKIGGLEQFERALGHIQERGRDIYS